MTGDLRPLNRLIYLAYENFRYRPLLPIREAGEAEGVVKIVGRRTPLRWLEGPGRVEGGYYAAGPGLPLAQALRYEEYGLEPVLAGDNIWPDEDDAEVYEILAGRNAEKQTWPQSLLAPKEIQDYLRSQNYPAKIIKAAKTNATKILKQAAEAQLIPAKLPVPVVQDKSLEQLCKIGISKKFVPKTWTKEHKTRLKKELDLIETKGYTDYFLIVADIVVWARERMLVGPAAWF